MKLITLFILFLSIGSITYSQDATVTGSESVEEVPKYDVSFKLSQLVYHIYRVTENTKVKRVFEDSTVNVYDKTVTHWYNVFVPSPIDENGFLLVEIKTDSVEYRLNSDNKKVYYISTDYEMELPLNFMDFFTSYVQYGQTFNMLYSSYGDVAKIDGEKLENERMQYAKTHDEIKRGQILYSLSNERLRFSFDVPKGIYPPFEVTKDTSWKSESQFFVCNVPVSGELVNTFNGYSNNEYHISTKMDSLSLKNPIENVILPDLDRNCIITSAVATGEMNTDLHTGGNVKYSRANLKALLTGKIGNLKFNQVVETTYTWDLIGKFQY
jgi:hypothetical protein